MAIAALGPVQASRSMPAEPFLGVLRAEARSAGVTRLGNLTHLDRIGFPVWQAVRPTGCAQSVHQGKGWCDLDAMIGALGEALESHRAEQVEPDATHLRWDDLPSESRCPDPRDCYSDRTSAATCGAIDWCEAHELRSGRTVYLPHLFVSLDFTLATQTPIERSSAGLATGTCLEEAEETALLEAIERDAVGEWERLPAAQRAGHRISVQSIPFDWFDAWNSRIRAAGATLRIFAFEAIEGTPVCVVFASGREEFGPAFRVSMGTAAHGSPEVALFKALAEALQSRLTVISGTRDDMLPSHYRPAPPGSLLGGEGLGRSYADFARLEPTCSSPARVAERLTAIGYADVFVRRLDPAGSTIPVVKLFVPGLGSLHSTRRDPR